MPPIPLPPPRLPRRQRRGPALLIALLATGCATTGSRTRAATGANAGDAGAARTTRLLVASCTTDVCANAAAKIAAGIETELGVRPTEIEIQRVAPAVPTPPPKGVVVRRALERGKQLYQTMQFAQARTELERALERVQRTHAAGLDPALLAQVHLYLAALAQAERDEPRARRHFDSAVAFAPRLEPDRDAFSPLVRNAVKAARERLASTTVSIATRPAGAAVRWDGLPREGRTPLELPEETLGEHYLRLQHPLYLPWADRIRVSTKATLEIELRPLPKAQLLAGAAAHPEHQRTAARALGLDALVWVEPTERGWRIATSAGDPGGEPLAATVDASLASTQIAAAARGIVGALGRRPEPVKDTHPPTTTRRSFWRRHWWIVPVGAAVVAAAIIVPLSLPSDPEGRQARLPLP